MSQKTSNKPADQLYLAIGFAMLNAAMLAAMSLFAKLLSQYFGPIEVTFFRNAFSLLALTFWLIFVGKLYLLKTERPLAHFFRSAIGTIGIALGMWSVSILSLSETTILLFTSPLFTAILSVLFLKEKIGVHRIIAIILGFAGVIIMAQPWHGFSLPVLGLITGLAWGLTSGAVDTTLRWMGKTENATTTTFYFMLLGTIATALHWPIAEYSQEWFSLTSLAIVAALGLTGLASVLAKSQSYRLGKASTIAPIMYTMIIWSALFDYIIYGEAMSLNVIAGGGLIIASNLYIIYRESKLKGKSTKQAQQSPEINQAL